ncbi:hypothetical protein C7U89_23830 [Bradyrhizobium sp. WBOS4]|nr:hypothetical protein [Bradyrhizobium sp. WBOS8]MDD1585943.1 hypothetical protein [Bradyrhizobium sp. WBOS4]UUO47718.1 hypothetical protein DCM78_12770 [Bradyrhizobium sp. WBOS04]UUO61337.1 hypothetical protein DCM80_20510 [Bradyrhizobium sp. WBOS08]
MRRAARIFAWTCGIAFALVLVVAASEVLHFATSTESSAREEAVLAFKAECARRGIASDRFEGPQRIKSPEGTYGFLWRDRSNADQIVTMTRYFPSGTESWSVGRDAVFQPH